MANGVPVLPNDAAFAAMGHPALSSLFCIASAYAIGLAIFPTLRRGGASAIFAVVLAGFAIIACLFLIPPQFRIHRAIATFICADLIFRLIDFARQNLGSGLQATSWARYVHFLIPFPTLLVVFGQKDRRRWPLQHPGREMLRALLGSAGVTVGFIFVFAAERSYVLQSSFLADHVAMLAIYMVTVESGAQALCGIERLTGYATTPIIDRAFISRTPAEFWRRWNNRIQPWLYWNVFLPSGGRRAPLRGIWATFLVSALFHELAFDFATSRVTGYQFTFFLIQAPAVMLSPALDRLASAFPLAGSAAAHAATILWMGTTSMFFFHGADLIFPFMYASEPWLP